MPTMPTGLEPIIEGYSFAGPGGVQRTEVAGGMPRTALMWDRGVQPYRVTMVLKGLEFTVWDVFYHHVIKKGALSFDMPLDSGFGLETHSAAIVPDSYNAVRTSGAIWTVTFTVEAESTVYNWTDDDATSLLSLWDLYGDGSSALLAAIAQFATVDSVVL